MGRTDAPSQLLATVGCIIASSFVVVACAPSPEDQPLPSASASTAHPIQPPPPGVFVDRTSGARFASTPARSGLIAADDGYHRRAIVHPSGEVVASFDADNVDWLEDGRLVSELLGALTVWDPQSGKGSSLPPLTSGARYVRTIRVGERDVVVADRGGQAELRDLNAAVPFLRVPDFRLAGVAGLGSAGFLAWDGREVRGFGLDGKVRFRKAPGDGWIAETSRDGRLVLLDGTELRQTSDGRIVKKVDGRARLSPAGTHLLVERTRGAEILDLANGKARRVSEAQVAHGGWSDDGARVAWMEKDDVFVATLEGAARRLATVPGVDAPLEVRGDRIIAHAREGTYAIDASGAVRHTPRRGCRFGPMGAPARIAMCTPRVVVTLGDDFSEVAGPRGSPVDIAYHPSAGLLLRCNRRTLLLTPDGGAPGAEAQRRQTYANSSHFADDAVWSAVSRSATKLDLATGSETQFDVTSLLESAHGAVDDGAGGTIAWGTTALARVGPGNAERWSVAASHKIASVDLDADRVIVSMEAGRTEVRALDDGRKLAAFEQGAQWWPGLLGFGAGPHGPSRLLDLATLSEIPTPFADGLTPDGHWAIGYESTPASAGSQRGRAVFFRDVRSGARHGSHPIEGESLAMISADSKRAVVTTAEGLALLEIPSARVLHRRAAPPGVGIARFLDEATVWTNVQQVLRVDDERSLIVGAVARGEDHCAITVHDGTHFAGDGGGEWLRYRRGGWLEPDFADPDAVPGLRRPDLVGAFFRRVGQP